MEYLGLVVKETLRLFPPRVWVQAACTRSTVACHVKIPRGIRVVVPIWVMHHSREFWDRPCQFNPLRFTSTEEVARDPHCFLPFGLRPLATVGSEVSIMLVKVALALVVKAYTFARCAQTPICIEIATMGSTRSKEPISLQVELP
ncbi:cytochrome P450 3A19-like [Leucoraja erinacea]|uniref:cytochrome P450 3A19-like n=1 Tax=Leucoraja erinaceus TaxID=7782 RepID=UPI00245386D5|nr:cytochrome P450 3A19-like [Leucoraja erinacea]